jgi:hypothetical protein
VGMVGNGLARHSHRHCRKYRLLLMQRGRRREQ